METRLYWRSVEGGGIALCSSAAPANRPKIVGASGLYQPKSISIGLIRRPAEPTEQYSQIYSGYSFNTPVIARPNHVLPLGFLS